MPIFAKFFGENIFKNHNIGPWDQCDYITVGFFLHTGIIAHALVIP
jgi:hypothetical protein